MKIENAEKVGQIVKAITFVTDNLSQLNDSEGIFKISKNGIDLSFESLEDKSLEVLADRFVESARKRMEDNLKRLHGELITL